MAHTIFTLTPQQALQGEGYGPRPNPAPESAERRAKGDLGETVIPGLESKPLTSGTRPFKLGSGK